MRRHLLTATAALSLLLAGCGGGAATTGVDDTTSADTPGEGTSDTPADDEPADPANGVASSPVVAIVAVDPGAGTMTLRNNGDTDVSTDGWWVCQRPSYDELDAITVPAGGTAEIDVSALGLTGSGGEIGVYTSNSFGSADAIVAYVQWGSGDHGRASVAVDAGVWDDPAGFVDNGGEAFTATIDRPDGADDYAVG